uniref:Allophycocyanin beta-18 subunit n=1 Tax=Gastroclonium compressum TaxID=1852973 RepID=A0A173FZY0_GASCM|nr:allophycocyanin beta-18 subunit [Coeloseira compressa]ANH09583.1 allophycocyanin beta-18 subunit [Coeloseira compressa]
MQDAITSILNKYNLTGKYLDKMAVSILNNYFSSALDRVQVIELINSNSIRIIKEAASRLYQEQPELLRPGGNSYTTRRYAACLRDMEYYLRYASYALIAGNTNILSERVLDGLKDTYNSLSVPIAPTVRSIQLLQKVLEEIVDSEDLLSLAILNEPFEYMIQNLSEQDI